VHIPEPIKTPPIPRRRSLTAIGFRKLKRRLPPTAKRPRPGPKRRINQLKNRDIWRRGWDSNPRYGCPYAAFRVRCFRPLSHLSALLVGALQRGAVHSGCRTGLQGGWGAECSSICHGDGNSLDSFHRLTYCARCSGIGLARAATLVLCAAHPWIFQAWHRARNHLGRRCANASSYRLTKRRPCLSRAKSRHEHERI
jgi:hypothetical protein